MSLSVEHDRIKDIFFEKGFQCNIHEATIFVTFPRFLIGKNQIKIYIATYIYNCKTELVYQIVLRYNLGMHFILKLQWIAMHKISCFSDIVIQLRILVCISSVYNLLRPIIQLLYIQMNIEFMRSWSKVNLNENLYPILLICKIWLDAFRNAICYNDSSWMFK